MDFLSQKFLLTFFFFLELHHSAQKSDIHVPWPESFLQEAINKTCTAQASPEKKHSNPRIV